MGRKGQSGHNKPKKSALSRNRKDINELVDKLLRISTILQQNDLSKSLENQKEISIITGKLRNLQIQPKNKINLDRSAGAATIDKFMNWCEENGAQLKGCKIENIEGFDLGLKVCTEIPPSSLVISVPRKLMLTIEAAKKTELKELIEKDQMLANMTNVALAIFLLFEKFKDESFWTPYINILPSAYTTVLYFNTEELEELKGSPTLEIALKQVKSISRQYAYFYKLFHTSNDPVSLLMREKFTYDEYW